MLKDGFLVKCLPVGYHKTHQTLTHVTVSEAICLQCGFTKAYVHAVSLSPKGDLSSCKEISGYLLNYIKQEEPRHAGGGGGVS